MIVAVPGAYPRFRPANRCANQEQCRGRARPSRESSHHSAAPVGAVRRTIRGASPAGRSTTWRTAAGPIRGQPARRRRSASCPSGPCRSQPVHGPRHRSGGHRASRPAGTAPGRHSPPPAPGNRGSRCAWRRRGRRRSAASRAAAAGWRSAPACCRDRPLRANTPISTRFERISGRPGTGRGNCQSSVMRARRPRASSGSIRVRAGSPRSSRQTKSGAAALRIPRGLDRDHHAAAMGTWLRQSRAMAGACRTAARSGPPPK